MAAVDGIDLAVPSGSVFGFLGPNGSGKTTTIRMMLGLLKATGGACELLGEAMPQRAFSALPRVGALVEGPAFYPWLSGKDNLSRFDAAAPKSQRKTRRIRIEEALGRVGLEHAAEKKYRAYSLGMRQRLGLASALLQRRELLVLDEPTNGMDPQGTREIRHLIRQLAEDGTTVFLSSHLLSEVEQVCTHIGVMHRGKLLTQGPIDELRGGRNRIRFELDEPDRGMQVLEVLGLSDIGVSGDEVTATLGEVTPQRSCAALVQAGIGVRSMVKDLETLEDRFVALTGEGFDVAG